MRRYLEIALLPILCCCASAGSGAGTMAPQAGAAQAAQPYLGRWDLTLHTASGDYPAWLEIRQDHGQLGIRMVGRWGHARAVPQAAIARGRLTFVSPGSEEGFAHGDLVFDGARAGDRLIGNVAVPGGETWSWSAEPAPALDRTPKLRAGQPVRLFNGRDLAGWTLGRGVATWRVSDGTLVSAGSGADLRSRARFEDFSLHVEFNCSPGANSGVYLRGRYEVQIEDDVEPEGPRERTGAIYGFLAPVVAAPRTPGVWHAYDITLIGRRVTVVLDGTRLIDNAEIPGITGGAIDSHEAAPGPIVLQGSERGQVAYRNIVLTPLLTVARADRAAATRTRTSGP